ncbi:MAG: biotin--[acetyl-CoA-carboxylase] ligase [Victivallales bacterium]|nr:biotin--[acetyl-CoA-carboxylase] ligase [Victivallales bacterium]
MPLSRETVFRLLHTRVLGGNLQFLDSCDSTNQVALDMAKEGAPEGLVVVSEVQTAGRGRQRRLWHSPPGQNLYFSILLRPQCPQARLPQLAVVAALALHQALRKVAPELNIGLKWPNDLWLNGHKLSGILCECPPQSGERCAIVVGIGLNVNARREDFPLELQATATSLAIAAGHDFDRETVLAEALNAFDKLYNNWLNSNDLELFIPVWEKADILRGRTITVLRPTDQLEGTVLGITSTGMLRLEVPAQGEVVVSAGDVHLKLDDQ